MGEDKKGKVFIDVRIYLVLLVISAYIIIDFICYEVTSTHIGRKAMWDLVNLNQNIVLICYK